MPRLWSRRFAGRVLNVGRVALCFDGEVAELPDWAEAEYAWILRSMPGILPLEARNGYAPPARPPSHAAAPAPPPASGSKAPARAPKQPARKNRPKGRA